MGDTMRELIGAYDAAAPLERATTIPKRWYTDERMADLERTAVFGRAWLAVARADELHDAGQYVTADVAGEPVVLVRGADGRLRGFFNVCRHHAAAVATEACGRAVVLRCPYHGWTYSLAGELKGTPEFAGVEGFDRAANGLVPLEVGEWEQFVFVRLAHEGPPLAEWLRELPRRCTGLRLPALRFFERRVYELKCNWKVFVDNYLDGGYHVPHAHKSLGSVLEYAEYRIESVGRLCVQSSPLRSSGGDAATASVRRGDMAYYFWLYPNFMLNWYEGVMDTNVVFPLGVDRCRVVFDFYFDDADAGEQRNRQSIAVAERVQQEDIDVCESVQRGLRSRAYETGRLSVRREGGEQQFHRLLHADLMRGAAAEDVRAGVASRAAGC